MHTLYLASQSYSRHMLLNQAGVAFSTITHQADELQYDADASIDTIVSQIAYNKMEHACLPDVYDGSVIFVLTADTLSIDNSGALRGKPRNYNDAVHKIQAARDGATVSTGFCLRKVERHNGAWNTIEEHAGAVSADIVVDIPDKWIDTYLAYQPHAMYANGAIAIEGYGLQFLKRISGSYTTVVGLPLYEIRNALDDLGYYALWSIRA